MNKTTIKKLFATGMALFLLVGATGCGETPTPVLKNEDLVLLDVSLEEEYYGIATKLDNTALRDRIQLALNESIADGSAAEISTKWFGKDTIYRPETPTVTPDPAATVEQDTIILGCDINFAPMGFKDGDEIVGFDIDLAREVIENKMGKTLKIQPIAWDNKEAELNTGKIDVIWNGLTINPERLENMCFTDPYMQNFQAIIVRSDSEITTKEQLNGKNIAMQKESTAVDAFDKSGIQANKTFELPDNVACLNELKTGRVDAVVMDSVVANYYLSRGDGATVGS